MPIDGNVRAVNLLPPDLRGAAPATAELVAAPAQAKRAPFVALLIGSILLIKGFLEQSGIDISPLSLSVWAIPSAVAALVIHGVRLMLLDRRLRRKT